MKCYVGDTATAEGFIMKRMKNLILKLIFGLTLVAMSIGHAAADGKKSGLVVSIDANNLPLKEVLANISRETAWSIVVDDRLIDKSISGKYKNIGLESFLKRSLKGEDIIVLYNDAAKSVDIRSFGEPSKMVTIKPSPPPEVADQKQLEDLRNKEKKAYEKYTANPDSIDPLTGMTLGEIAALHAAEEKKYKEYSSNPNSVDPVTGMTLGEVNARRASAQQSHDKYTSNPNSVDPLTGKTLGEIMALRDKEQKAADTSSTTIPKSTPQVKK